MHTDKIKSRLLEDSIEIENISDDLLENCFISVRNLFAKDILDSTFNLKSGEKKTFHIYKEREFKNAWADEALRLRVYSNHRLIHEKTLNDKTKCYVLISNKKFEKVVEQLIIGLDRYSNADILHYTVGYKSSLDYCNLKNIEFTIKGDPSDGQYMQFAKPPVFLDVLEKGYKAAVFLDADIQIRSNIDTLFNYIKEIEDGPVLHNGYHDFTIINNKYIPGPLVSSLMGLPEDQPAPQGITNIVVFNHMHKHLFKEWEELCFSDDINEIRKTEFLHDELLLNCLMWKKGIKPKQYHLAVNIRDEEDVNFFYNSKQNDYEQILDMNHYNKGYVFQSFIKYDRESTCVFHCVKDADIAKKINDIIYKKEIQKDFKRDLIDFYKDLTQAPERVKEVSDRPKIINHYVNGPYIEIKADSSKKYEVEFLDGQNKVIYRTAISGGMWCASGRKYYDDYTARVYENNQLIYSGKINLKGKRVYIALCSSALGDSLAWLPYAEEFRKHHGCKVIVSTFKNDLFRDLYPDLEFVEPGTAVNNIYAMYNIGWFYGDDDKADLSKHPREFKDIPLQQTASDILGLAYKEVKPLLRVPDVPKKKRVGIAIHGTAQPKYWNNPTGWQEVTDYLKSEGYEVVLYSKEGDSYMGNYHPRGITRFEPTTLENLIKDMATCEFFIGIGSGLSWLAWAINLPVFLISGFSEEYSEPMNGVTRIINKNVCHGCFNRLRLDAGDWNWCPDHKGTERQFECTKSITGSMVINKIKEWAKR